MNLSTRYGKILQLITYLKGLDKGKKVHIVCPNEKRAKEIFKILKREIPDNECKTCSIKD